jgi:large subunit ribosomal protein L10
MKKELKNQIIESISAALQQYPNFYLTNIEGLNAEQTVKLRRACFDEGIKLNVVKNTLFAHVIKGMENEELMQLVPVLEGNTAIMYTESPNGPAKLIKKLQKDLGGKPELKGAYVQECAFIGADKLDELCAIKSKEELIGDIISLLQAPMRNVISALQNGGGQTIAGLVKTLSEKEEK